MRDTRCPNCQIGPGRLAIPTDYFLYLRCEQCGHIWTQPERRARKRFEPAGSDS